MRVGAQVKSNAGLPPPISIVLPTFDRLPLLREAIMSVISQTHKDWRLIIVDDGSRDGTAEYLRTLDDSRIEVVSVEHCGNPARLRNLGIARARHEWIAFLDSDDVWMPRKIENQWRELAAHGDCRWSYTNARLIDETGAELPLENFEPWTAHSGNVIHALLTHKAAIPCPSVLVRRDLLESAGGFDESLPFSEDYDLWLRLAARSPVWAVTEPLCKVRLHPGNNTRDKPEVNQSFIRVYDKFLRDNEADPGVQRLCDRQRAFYWVHFARQMWQRGDHVRSASALATAFRYHPTHPEWWSVVTKKILRPLLPASVRDWYRVVRRRHGKPQARSGPEPSS